MTIDTSGDPNAMNFTHHHFGITDVGRMRRFNEDAWFADPEQGIYLVSDGIGGQNAGALAAKVVSEVLPELVQKGISSLEPMDSDAIARHVCRCICDLSNQLCVQASERPGYEGMGATVVMALLWGGRVLIAHLGDSRAYLYRLDSLRRLTRDHSLIQVLMDAGELTEAEAARHPARMLVTQSVGMRGHPEPDSQWITLEPGDRLLLCSDGLTNMISDDCIHRILAEHHGLKLTGERLVAAANEAGGKDNITALLLAPEQPASGNG